MLVHKRLQKEVEAHGETAIALMSAPTVIGLNIIAQVIVFWLAGQQKLFPGADAFLSMTATCSEVIAGLYGTTLAGYTFFLSRIDALMASDATLDYVVTSIKTRFKYLIWYITLNVLATLTISISLMYVPVPAEEQAGFLYRLFCNEFVLFLSFSIVMILYYSIQVINPNCIEKEAARLKRKLSCHGRAGSTVEYISLYDRIEAACNSMVPENVLNQLHENKGNRFEYTVELLGEQSLLMLPLIKDLTRIHRYYVCTVNCTPLWVSEEMCGLARQVCAAVEQIAHKTGGGRIATGQGITQ